MPSRPIRRPSLTLPRSLPDRRPGGRGAPGHRLQRRPQPRPSGTGRHGVRPQRPHPAEPARAEPGAHRPGAGLPEPCGRTRRWCSSTRSTPRSGKLNRIKSKLTNTQIIQAGAAPGLWIDEAGLLKPFADDSRAQGPIVPFGVEPMVLAVKAGQPGPRHGPRRLRRRGTHRPAAAATARPAASGPSPGWARPRSGRSYEVKVLDAPALVAAITAGKVDAGLVLSLTIPPATPPSPPCPWPPPAPSITYRMLGMSPNPTAVQFEKWVATSPRGPHRSSPTPACCPASGKGCDLDARHRWRPHRWCASPGCTAAAPRWPPAPWSCSACRWVRPSPCCPPDPTTRPATSRTRRSRSSTTSCWPTWAARGTSRPR